MSNLMTAPVPSPGNALRLSWSFGFQKDLVAGVHSLSTASRRAVFYPAAHTGVIYDFARRQQTLLQGHCHLISCCAVSEDKRWIVTADRGPESMLVVWDAATGNPIKTIFRPHPLGVEALDLSPDALFIATLSAVDREEPEGGQGKSKRKRFDQELSIWEWTATSANPNAPLHSSYVATEDVQHSVRFNSYDVREVVTNGRQRVIFWSWASHKLLFYSPSLSQRDFRQVVGNFTQSLFVPDSTQALTGTEDGDLVLWDIAASTDAVAAATIGSGSPAHLPDRKAVKIVRLGGSSSAEHKKSAALTVLTDMDGYLVLGSSDGAVRFFDFDFRLVAWFEDMNAGAVTSVSFASADEDEDTNKGNEGEEESFIVPDFVVGTASAFIVGMSATLFGEHEPEKRRGTLLMQGINDAIHGLAAHPRLPQLALSSYSGVVQLWDYVGKRLIMMRRFDPERGFRPQCLAFSPDGKRLFVGFTSGAIKILHAQKLEDVASFRLGKAAITDVRVSPDSTLFIALDANLYMGMWRCKLSTAVSDNDDLSSPSGGDEWVYIGRCRSHSKPVTGLEFACDGDGNLSLVSVAEDRTMVEYALDRCSVLDGIVLKQAPTRIEQSGAPTACCWHPEMRGLQEDLVVVANDEYKLKQWNASNKTCRKTTLGPCYGGPINKLVPVPLRRSSGGLDADEDAVSERYCAYSTHEKVVGLLKLPLDGNPHKVMGLIAHPGAISNVDVTFDGNFLLTAGVEDLVVNMWEIHTSHLDMLEAESAIKAENTADAEVAALAPYLSLLEGGADGAFFHEIVDYFYLAQLRVQGEDATAAREISGRIPLREIPNVMRAIGFYPTDQEIQHMCSEVKFSKFTQTSETVESLDLPEFVKLYVNHRPVFGVGKAQIERAFEVLAQKSQQRGVGDKNGVPSLSWELLEARLLHSGEAMTEDELHSCLKALVVSADGTKSGVDAMDREYTALALADKVLGFDDYDEEQDGEDGSLMTAM
jgi:WD40 repeat protein/Ca2+-binding EF-hand superfamily protein